MATCPLMAVMSAGKKSSLPSAAMALEISLFHWLKRSMSDMSMQCFLFPLRNILGRVAGLVKRNSEIQALHKPVSAQAAEPGRKQIARQAGAMTQNAPHAGACQEDAGHDDELTKFHADIKAEQRNGA